MSRLIPRGSNPRTHGNEQIAQIAASISKFGWTSPILVGPDHIIIAGHGRLLAARNLGMTEVPVIVLAKADYSKLDAASSPVRIRLNSTVVKVKHNGDPASAKQVEVTYATGKTLKTVRAANCIRIC